MSADQGYYPPGQPAAGQPSYQPVFDRYAPRTAPPQSQAYAPNQQHAPAFDPNAGYRGGAHDQWQQQAPQAHAQQHSAPPAPAAPRGYDFSNYMPAAAPDYGAARQAAAEEPQWQLSGEYDRRNEMAQDASAYLNQHLQAEQQAYADEQAYNDEAAGQLQHADDQGYDQDDHPDYEDDEPSKSRRGLIMVSALVGAIALGGGMAYAYKTFIKPTGSSQVAKVSAPKGPAKTQPVEPGGKQFPNQDSKLQNRLGDGSASPSGSASNQGETDGVRRVGTVTVGRDGSLSAPAPAQATAAIPGMVVQMPAAPAQAAPVAQSAVAAASAAAPPVAQPRAVVVPQARTVVASIDAAPPEAAAPAPAKKATAQKKPAAPRDDLIASNGGANAAPAATPAPAKAGGSGFVAVIASRASKADAQKANTDLEQKFDVLKGKIFDVQEADLTAQGKGVVYRSVVGPPGSRAFANGVCDQLKSVGYNDCWPVKY